MIIAIALKSIIAFLLLQYIVRPLTNTIWRHLPDGTLKRILFISWR